MESSLSLCNHEYIKLTPTSHLARDTFSIYEHERLSGIYVDGDKFKTLVITSLLLGSYSIWRFSILMSSLVGPVTQNVLLVASYRSVHQQWAGTSFGPMV